VFKKRLLRALLNLLHPSTSEFWTGTVNTGIQVVVRFLLPHDLEITPVANQLADVLLAFYTYAAGRVVSKVVSPIKD
jgi:hypothetical protein